MLSCAIVLSIVMPIIIPKLQKREKEDNKKAVEKREVRMDRLLTRFYKFGCVFISLGAIVFLIPQVCEVMEVPYVVMFVICCVFLALMYSSSWIMLKRVDYTDEYFEYTNPLGRKKRFMYSDVEKVKYTAGIIRIYANNKKSFIIFKAYAGSNEFVMFIKEKNQQVEIITN